MDMVSFVFCIAVHCLREIPVFIAMILLGARQQARWGPQHQPVISSAAPPSNSITRDAQAAEDSEDADIQR